LGCCSLTAFQLNRTGGQCNPHVSNGWSSPLSAA
jgi:hypothetical protein